MRRVLVTGFHDWKDLGDPPNIWRCRDNPSCRLLTGAVTHERPTRFDGGPLPKHLRAATGEAIDWSFATLPVTWGAADTVALEDYDVVLHIGLGVYDRFDQILVESGAFNRRRGVDAGGLARDEAIASGRDEVLPPPAEIRAQLARVDGQRYGDYEVRVAPARESNSYLCNETHFKALEALEAARASGARPRQVHFVHIPYAKDDDFEMLAEGVSGVLMDLLGPSKSPPR